MRRAPLRSRDLVLAGALALALGAGPTVGDVGSCGRSATDLDEASFLSQRKGVDCERCRDCGLQSQSCKGACDPKALGTAGWPTTCHPLQHDGDVCLNALLSASCSDYASFMDDVAPTIPTECDFCHVVPPPVGTTPTLPTGDL